MTQQKNYQNPYHNTARKPDNSRYESPFKKSKTATKIKEGSDNSSPVLPFSMQKSHITERRSTEKSLFIKKAGDERVSCMVTITVQKVKVASRITNAEQRGPLAIQILRGPLRSETKEFYLPENPAVTDINHVF